MADLNCTGDAIEFVDEAGDKIVFARHVRFTTAEGLPVVRVLDPLVCVSAPPEFPHLRHVRYGATTGLPVGAEAWACCDAFCTDAEELAEECYVQETCWPYGPGPGIAKRVRAYIAYREPCTQSGRTHSVILVYDATDEKWYGKIPIVNGDLCLAFSCDPLLDFDDVGKFIFEFQRTDCVGLPGSTGVVVAGFDCLDPLKVNFPPFGLPLCCPGMCDPGDSLPNVTVVILTNCRKTIFARHVGYEGVPLVARPKPCNWNVVPPEGCCGGTIPGGLTLEFYDVSMCCVTEGQEVTFEPCNPENGMWVGGLITCGAVDIRFDIRCGLGLGDPPGTGWEIRPVFDGVNGSWTPFNVQSCPPLSLDMTDEVHVIAWGICGVDGGAKFRVTETP